MRSLLLCCNHGFLPRFTTVIVFFFTCFLTLDVVAKENELAPILSPDAWKLLSDAEAYAQGFRPADVKTLQLKPRSTPVKKNPFKTSKQ